MTPSAARRWGAVVVAVVLAASLAVVAWSRVAGAPADDRRAGSPSQLLETPPPAEVQAQQLAATPRGERLPLRAGEHRLRVSMPAAYTPSAPTGEGTDDYRCFLLDPGLDRDVWLTGSDVLPGNPQVVHHVILFQVPPESVAAAEAKDAQSPEQGWTCFGGSGLQGGLGQVDDADWLAAWAPGGDETRTQTGYGVRLRAGSRIVVQVHYNLLRGSAPDVTSADLRWMDGDRDLTPLHTYLMPAPVELPCRPEHADGALCDRAAAQRDVNARFGTAGSTGTFLHLLCGTDVEPGPVSTCTRTVGRAMTVIAAAGHMHLLGRRIAITSSARAAPLLRIPVWDFDDQGARRVDPLHLDPGDTLTVTCQHQQWLRDRLPAFETQREDRYVLWAEGSTDEMCLGMLQVAYDDET